MSCSGQCRAEAVPLKKFGRNANSLQLQPVCVEAHTLRSSNKEASHHIENSFIAGDFVVVKNPQKHYE